MHNGFSIFHESKAWNKIQLGKRLELSWFQKGGHRRFSKFSSRKTNAARVSVDVIKGNKITFAIRALLGSYRFLRRTKYISKSNENKIMNTKGAIR
jgi:hypothetical protein